MINLSDIMTQAPAAAMETFARQYRLTPEQADATVEALLPAFALALKQMASSPGGLAQLFNMMAQANYHAMRENPAYALSPKGIEAGNEVLAAMFGSNELRRAVAEQAAQFAGVGAAAMQQMLPAFAAMLMGGLSERVPATEASQPQEPTPPQSAEAAPKQTAEPAASAEAQAFVGQMFETGREIQKAHFDNMQRLFEAFFEDKRR